MSGAGSPDFYYREAQRLGYLARSAFKLLQMQNKYKLITPGASVLDLGCAPGAWLQVACQSLGPLKNGGKVVGIDLKLVEYWVAEQKVKVPSVHCDSRVQTVSADVMNFRKDQVRSLSAKGKGYSVILSDMCPPVSGITTKDAALSIELGMRALNLAIGSLDLPCTEGDIHDEKQSDGSSSGEEENGILLPGGNLVIKLLESEDVNEVNQICKGRFKKAALLRPKATRLSSREIYLICQGLR